MSLTEFETGELVQASKDTREDVKEIKRLVGIQNGRTGKLEELKADRDEVTNLTKAVYKMMGIGMASAIVLPIIVTLIMNSYGG